MKSFLISYVTTSLTIFARKQATAPEPAPASTTLLLLLIPVSAIINPISFKGIICASLLILLYKSVKYGSKIVNSFPMFVLIFEPVFDFKAFLLKNPNVNSFCLVSNLLS